MKILYINHYAGHLNYGMEFRPFYFAREWKKQGHETLIVGASFSHLRKKNPQHGFEKKDGVQYLWLKTPKYKGNGIGRVLNIFFFTARLFSNKKKILKHINPDVVVASSTHPFDIFPAWWIAKRTKAQLVFEIHDLWPLSIIELGGMSKYHPFVCLVGIAEKIAYRVSDKIISILPKTYEHVKKMGVSIDDFSVVPNGIVMEDWKDIKESNLPKHHQEEINSLKKQGKFLVGYTGAHGVANALESFLDAAKILEKEDISMVLIGGGQERNNLIKHAEKNKIKNVIFLAGIPKTAIPTALEKMDALYIGLQDQALFRYGISPNKIFDYMMAGKPIIQSINAGNDPITEAKCGISISDGNAKKIAAAILNIKNMSKEERKKLGKNGQVFVKKNHSYTALSQNFIKALEKK